MLNRVCRLARQNTPTPLRCVPSNTEVKVLLSVYAHFIVLEKVNQHTQFGYQNISGTEDMRYIKMQ